MRNAGGGLWVFIWSRCTAKVRFIWIPLPAAGCAAPLAPARCAGAMHVGRHAAQLTAPQPALAARQPARVAARHRAGIGTHTRCRRVMCSLHRQRPTATFAQPLGGSETSITWVITATIASLWSSSHS